MRWTDRIGRRLKLRDLHTLRVVVDTGSMAQAAKQLALSQPAISKSIADIEHTLGVSLLDRMPRGVVPTPYADVLLKRGTVIFDDLRLALEEIEHLRDPTQGELRVGAPEPLVPLLTVIIDGLVSRYPRIHFDVAVADTSLLLGKLRGRELDVGITRLPDAVAEADDLETEVLYDDPLVVMAGQASRWLRRRHVGLADLAHERWTLSPPETLLGRFAAEVFQSRGLALPSAVVVTSSVQMRLSLVATGRYLSILPRAMLRVQRNASLRALRIDLSETKRPVGLVLLNKRTIAPIASLFIAAARQAISKSRAPSTSTKHER
jgi:DNA-binding transcriptional LysR family regulator